MLRKFSVANFKTFDKKIEIDFSKVRDYSFNNNLIHNDLVRTSLLYGKNAVGKTSLSHAIIDIRFTLLGNRNWLHDNIGFLNANSEEDSARFAYEFLIENHKIEYSYEKSDPETLSYEELIIDGELLYKFNFNEDIGNLDSLKNNEELEHLNFENWEDDIPILRYILNNSKLNELSILKSLKKFVEGMVILKPSDNKVNFVGPKIITTGIISTIIESGRVQDLEEFFRKCDIDVKLKVEVTPEGEKRLYFDYKRPIEFVKYASSGTLALTALYIVLNKLADLSFVFIDEFDANFHYELAKNMLVHTIEHQACQMILTTHNTDLMTNKFLRPDCYFIMMPNRIVSVAEATKRELRQGHNLEKLYQSGEFNFNNEVNL